MWAISGYNLVQISPNIRITPYDCIIAVSELDKTPSLGADIQGALLISLPRLLEQLHMMPNLKAAANHGVGYNHIDIKGDLMSTMAWDIL